MLAVYGDIIMWDTVVPIWRFPCGVKRVELSTLTRESLTSRKVRELYRDLGLRPSSFVTIARL